MFITLFSTQKTLFVYFSSIKETTSNHASRNDPRHPNYQSSIRHHNVHDNAHTDDSFIVEHEYIAQQIRNQYQTLLFQPLPYEPVLPSVEVQGPYDPTPNYEQIDDVYVATHPISADTFHYVNFWNNLLIESERNSTSDYFRSLYNHEEKEDDVLKYLIIRTHHAPVKDDGIDLEVVVVDDVELDICAICQSEYEHEESIGALQCGHEYHTDCIKQWLLKKKDCPMCRASVLPSQEQRSA